MRTREGGRYSLFLKINKLKNIPGMSRQEETPRKTQDMLERLCRSAGLGTPWDPPGRAGGSVRGEGGLGVPAQAAAPATRPQISGR